MVCGLGSQVSDSSHKVSKLLVTLNKHSLPFVNEFYLMRVYSWVERRGLLELTQKLQIGHC